MMRDVVSWWYRTCTCAVEMGSEMGDNGAISHYGSGGVSFTCMWWDGIKPLDNASTANVAITHICSTLVKIARL